MAYIFGKVLEFCNFLVPNYVFAILLFALLMQILLCPFGIIQQKNMVKQAKMRPMEYIIRKKYAGRNDRATMQKMQNEIMELQQREGYNPMKGCLPMLLQLILIFPIYRVVVNPLQYITGLSESACKTIVTCFQHVFDDIPNSGAQINISQKLSSMSLQEVDNVISAFKNSKGDFVIDSDAAGAAMHELKHLAEGGFDGLKFANVPETLGHAPFDLFGDFGGLWFLIFIPLVNLGLTYLSQFVSKKLSYQDPYANQQAGGMMSSMKIMMLVMPLMTFFFTFSFPAAIGVYWIFRTLLAMLQQFILSRFFKFPKYTDEDLKRIEKEMKEAKQQSNPKKKRLFQLPTQELEEKGIRSLHHIDDDED